MSVTGPAKTGTHYEVLTQEDKTTKDVLIPIPPILLKQLGWKEGDNIEFGMDAAGNHILKRVDK